MNVKRKYHITILILCILFCHSAFTQTKNSSKHLRANTKSDNKNTSSIYVDQKKVYKVLQSKVSQSYCDDKSILRNCYKISKSQCHRIIVSNLNHCKKEEPKRDKINIRELASFSNEISYCTLRKTSEYFKNFKSRCHGK